MPIGLYILGLSVVLLQRIGITVAGAFVPLVPVLAFLVIIVGLVSGRFSISAVRLLLFFGFVTTGLIDCIFAGSPTSMTSIGLVALIWAPLVIEPRNSEWQVSRGRFLSGVVHATLLGALGGVLQTLAEFATGVWVDPIRNFLPAGMVISGYNDNYVVAFGGFSWHKAIGWVFLEPSFLSLFTMLAAILIIDGIVLARWRAGAKAVVLIVLAGGFFASVAVSGLVLLPILILAVIRGWRSLLTSGVVVGLVFVLFTVVPVLQAWVGRATTGGSNDARLVRPYTELLPLGLGTSPIMGAGPGTSSGVAAALGEGAWEQQVTTPTIVKLIYEYGVVGALFLVIAAGLLLSWSSLALRAKLALLVILIVPTDGLASPILPALFIFGLIAAGPRDVGLHAAPTSSRSLVSKRRVLPVGTHSVISP